MNTAEIEILSRKSPKLRIVKPDRFRTFYSPKPEISGLEEGIRRIGGGHIELALGYGSFFSGVASGDSIPDVLLSVRNPWRFYQFIASERDVKLGTIRDPGFHALWNTHKVNFYLGEVNLDGSKQDIKIGVIGHSEMLKHARGGMPGNKDGKGKLYLAGRLHKAVLAPILNETTPSAQQEIDLAINQARIDGVWLALGLLPRYFEFKDLTKTYVNLSYAADRRVEKANKAQSLLDNNEEYYRQMLYPILNAFKDCGIVQRTDSKSVIFEKRMSLTEEDVRKWLKESGTHAFIVNFFENIWTMRPFKGALYGLAKARRSRG